MKYRINLGQNHCDGSPIYRIYRGEGEAWILITSDATLDGARDKVYRLANPQPEVTIEEKDV